jgi:hypothetical protein
LALGGAMYRGEQDCVDVRLLHESGGADLARALDVACLVGAGKDHDLDGRVRATDPACRLDPVQYRHADVHHDHLRRKVPCKRNTSLAVVRATDDLDPLVSRQQHVDELRGMSSSSTVSTRTAPAGLFPLKRI